MNFANLCFLFHVDSIHLRITCGNYCAADQNFLLLSASHNASKMRRGELLEDLWIPPFANPIFGIFKVRLFFTGKIFLSPGHENTLECTYSDFQVLHLLS